MSKNRSSFAPDGFTLIEAVIVIAIIGVATAVVVPAIQQQVHRTKLQGYAREAGTLLQKARFESIKNNVLAVVEIDPTNGLVFAFADLHGTNVTDPSDGIFNPIGGATARTTDYEIGRLGLPPGVLFAFLTDLDQASVDGFTTGGDPAIPQAIFQSDGSVLEQGAFRFADRRNNYLEARVSPEATARVEVRKWDSAAAEWRAFGEGGEPWKWN